MRYKNLHRKPLRIGAKSIKPGDTFTASDAAAAGVDVAALVRARTVTPVKTKASKKPAARKRKQGG